MATTRIFDVEVEAFQQVTNTNELEGDGAGCQFRTHHAGERGELQLREVELAPNQRVLPHAHADDEIITVVEGALHIGSRSVGIGSSVYVPGHTLYAFSAGPSGVRF